MAHRTQFCWLNFGSGSSNWRRPVETPIQLNFPLCPAPRWRPTADTNMDLLLTHGYFLYEDPKELQIMKPYVPLGILYLASHLRARNFDVEVFDTTFSSRQDLWRLLESAPPAVLGVYANLMTRSSVVGILRAAKEAGWTTVVGG